MLAYIGQQRNGKQIAEVLGKPPKGRSSVGRMHRSAEKCFLPAELQSSHSYLDSKGSWDLNRPSLDWEANAERVKINGKKSSEAKKWQGMNACAKYNVISTSHKLWRLFAVWVTGKVHGRSVFLDRSLTVFWYARFHSRPQSIHCCNFTMEVSTLPAKISDKSMVAWPMSCRVAWSGGLGPVYCFATQSATFCHCMSLALCFSLVQVRRTVHEETGCSCRTPLLWIIVWRISSCLVCTYM